MSDPGPPLDAVDARYVAARRVLLDALEALVPHHRAVVVVGAQAIYLRTGALDLGIAPYTTDGDLVLDPDLLDGEPELEVVMVEGGFELLEPQPDRPEPGIWVTPAVIDGVEVKVPVDLIVPDAAAAGGGRRGARLGVHGRRAARRIVGVEGALVDRSPMTVAGLEPSDGRSFEVEVAGPAALLVAKAHKLSDRLASGRTDRIDDKDAADVVRIVQTTNPAVVAERLALLRADALAGTVTESALRHLDQLVGRRGARGVMMAARALQFATLTREQIAALCTAYVAAIRSP